MPTVDYNSNFYRVSIYWDYGRKYELELILYTFKKRFFLKLEKDSIELDTLVLMHNPDYKFGDLMPRTNKDINRELQVFADLLIEYGKDILGGDSSDFETFRLIRDEMEARQLEYRTYYELVDAVYRKHSKEHLRNYHRQGK